MEGQYHINIWYYTPMATNIKLHMLGHATLELPLYMQGLKPLIERQWKRVETPLSCLNHQHLFPRGPWVYFDPTVTKVLRVFRIRSSAVLKIVCVYSPIFCWACVLLWLGASSLFLPPRRRHLRSLRDGSGRMSCCMRGVGKTKDARGNIWRKKRQARGKETSRRSKERGEISEG